MLHDLTVLLSSGISRFVLLVHICLHLPCNIKRHLCPQHGSKRFRFSAVKQLSGLVPFDTSNTGDADDREGVQPWENVDK